LWFSGKHYGIISGLTVLLGNVGAILAAKPLAMLLEFYSWRTIFVGIGIFSLILAFLAIIFVKNKPEDAGFPSLQTTLKENAKFNLLEGLKTVLKTRSLWRLFWLNFGLAGSFFAFIGLWAVPLLRDACDIARSESSQYTSFGLLIFAITAFVIGGISDRLGKRKILLVIGISIYALSWLSFYFMTWQSGISLFVMFGLFGLGAGCFVLTYPLAKEAVEPTLSGMALSLVNMGIFLGAAIMQPLFGVVLDLYWQGTLQNEMRIYPEFAYRSALYLMLGCSVLSLISVWRVREKALTTSE